MVILRVEKHHYPGIGVGEDILQSLQQPLHAAWWPSKNKQHRKSWRRAQAGVAKMDDGIRQNVLRRSFVDTATGITFPSKVRAY